MPRLTTVTRTYLTISQPEHLVPPALERDLADSPIRLERCEPCDTAAWRSMYAQVGGPWHWHDRDVWTDERLRAHLERDAVRVFVVRVRDEVPGAPPSGMLELEQHENGSVEIVYLGLDQRLMGRRLGAWLVYHAVQEAFCAGAPVWLHTCTLDAPAALPNYLARGFVATRTEQYETTIPD